MSLTKKLILFSAFTHSFFIRKFISVADPFLRGGVGGGGSGGNSLKLTYVEEDTGETNRDEQMGRGSKRESFKWTYFLNDP